MLTAEKNRLPQQLDPALRKRLRAHITWLTKELELTEQERTQLTQQSPACPHSHSNRPSMSDQHTGQQPLLAFGSVPNSKISSVQLDYLPQDDLYWESYPIMVMSDILHRNSIRFCRPCSHSHST
jgi:hypothetical protein